MVCIAAFIILGIIVLTVPIIRLFNKRLANTIVKLFRKSMHCFSRRVTLRACDTSFKDDIKGSILSKVILKHPKWVKPLSALIEFLSVVIVITTVWSILVGAKALVSLYVYGTCNPTTPSACSLDSSEACSIDSPEIDFWQHPIDWTGNWFGEFGEAIAAIPTKMKYWDAKDYLPEAASYYHGKNDKRPLAIDIFDPGCIVCQRSFNAQTARGFFDKYNVVLLPYPIPSSTEPGGYKFKNSYLVTTYIIASKLKPLDREGLPAAWKIAKRMYTEKDANGDRYQNAFNMGYDAGKAESVLQDWLKDFGYSKDQIKEIAELAKSDKVKEIIKNNMNLVKEKVKTKKIPSMIFNGTRHDGEFTNETTF